MATNSLEFSLGFSSNPLKDNIWAFKQSYIRPNSIN
jgi:hypothetical protein